MWSTAADMSWPRYSHFLLPFASGQVVAFGGARVGECCWTGDSFVREIESYDPATNTWRTIAMLPVSRVQAAALVLTDGCAWLSGGRQLYTTYAADSWLICAR
jgi:hypothetical protein